jgi:hypothetical protein
LAVKGITLDSARKDTSSDFVDYAGIKAPLPVKFAFTVLREQFVAYAQLLENVPGMHMPDVLFG